MAFLEEGFFMDDAKDLEMLSNVVKDWSKVAKKIVIFGVIAFISGIVAFMIFHNPYNRTHSDDIFIGAGTGILFISIILWFIIMSSTIGPANQKLRTIRGKKIRGENIISQINRVGKAAGYSSSDIDKLRNLTIVILKEEATTDDWTLVSPRKVTASIQTAVSLLGKKPPKGIESLENFES
jgi:uncharacterized membrane protein